MASTSEPEEPHPQKLSPGMILGPDGKPCKTCTAFRNWKPVSGPTKERDPVPKPKLTEAEREARCPPDVEVLGRSTWNFLHTTAAYYPEKPSPGHQSHMMALLSSLPSLYPCSHCAAHLKENIEIHPPDVSGRGPLSKWLCARHNDVNERLGKSLFNCDISKLDERWKEGPKDGSCD